MVSAVLSLIPTCWASCLCETATRAADLTGFSTRREDPSSIEDRTSRLYRRLKRRLLTSALTGVRRRHPGAHTLGRAWGWLKPLTAKGIGRLVALPIVRLGFSRHTKSEYNGTASTPTTYDARAAGTAKEGHLQWLHTR